MFLYLILLSNMQNIKNSIILTKNFGEIKNFFKSLNLTYIPYLIFDCNIETINNLSQCDLDNKQKYSEYICYEGKNKVKKKDLAIKFISQNLGFGIFANQEFLEGDFLGEFCGKVTTNLNSESKHYYFRYINNTDYIIAPRNTGNEMQFVNHSYTPNCDWLRIIGNDNKYHIIIVAIKEIKKGEELLVNYGEEYWKSRDIEPV